MKESEFKYMTREAPNLVTERNKLVYIIRCKMFVEKTRKKWKKVLTRWGWCGILTELSTRTASVNDETKKFEKTRKKFLTNRIASDILNNVPLMRRVPCKLNNETNEKHQTVLLKY